MALLNILKSKNVLVNEDYYNKIQKWRQMWRNKADYLDEQISDGVTGVTKRTRFSLGMTKKVAEDWASIFSENNQITLSNDQYEEEVKDYLASINFWGNINEQLELGFAVGTIACLIRGTVTSTSLEDIYLDFVSAENIFPLTLDNGGNITECVFASNKLIGGKKYTLIETHKLKENGQGYVITNELFDEQENPVNVELLGIVPELESDFKTFFIFKPNLLNNIENNNGLGMSVYHNAYDNFVAVDYAFDVFASDLRLGKKMVFMSTELLQVDANGNYITPQDANKELMRWVQTGEEKGDLIKEFNPALRVAEDELAVQKQLDYLSFKVGFGTKHYQFNAGSIVTATQYVGDKQEMLKYVKKHFNNYKYFVENILNTLFALKGWAVECTIPFEDSIVMDDESMKASDLLLVQNGIMQKWEFRVKWFNETEEEAKKNAVSEDPFIPEGNIY